MKTKMGSDIIGKIRAMIETNTETNNLAGLNTLDVLKLMLTGFEESNRTFNRIDATLNTLVTGQDNLLVEVRDVKRRVIHLEFQMGDVQESLHYLEEAEGKDAMASINHEGRIVRLEKIHNIQAVPPQHLTDIE